MMEEETCPKCQSNLIFTKTEDTIHYGKISCQKCGRWIKWVKNPNRERRRIGTSKYSFEKIMEFHNFSGDPFCFFCLRTKEMLGKHETLTRDHIQELDKGGKDELGNMQILCSACHKLKNWARLYMNWHLKK